MGSGISKKFRRGLRSMLPVHEQADDAADGVLLDSYGFAEDSGHERPVSSNGLPSSHKMT